MLKLICTVVGVMLLSISPASAEEMTIDRLFRSDRVLEVKITVAEKDWNTIRTQSRDFMSALDEARKEAPIEPPYTYVEASVVIDGVEFPRVGLRKKGFIGSQSRTRPSLKIKLDHLDPKGGVQGLNNLTFNNNRQDRSQVSQVMGYAFFNDAGAPASRCSFAHVTVNGNDLGIYSHVESVRKPMLKRAFGESKGTLFEGTVVDFNEGWGGSFELKRGDDAEGRAKILALIEALSDARGARLDAGARRAWVPTDGDSDLDWLTAEFDDSSWVSGAKGAGYGERFQKSLSSEFDFGEALREKGTSVYMRVPFDVSDPNAFVDLTLRMRFDDGFVAYINGHRVAAANAPDAPRWDSTATGNAGEQNSFRPFYISEHKDKLRPGRNVLAIHGLNVDASSPDLLIAPELYASETSALTDIEQLVDLDSFFRFWAVEGLLGFWDGYSGNRNNYFVYLHSKEDKFRFLPWGADSLFVKYSMIDRDRSVPLSVKATGLLAHRLYQLPEMRQRYRDTMNQLLADHWNEASLLAETDRIEAMLLPYTPERGAARFSEAIEKVREFIRTRRGDLVAEISDGMPQWKRPPAEPAVIPATSDWAKRRRERMRESLWSAARRGSTKDLEKFLARVDVNQKDGMGSTALSWAVGLGRMEAVEFLIDKGANVNALNRDGTTPLDQSQREFSDEIAGMMSMMFRIDLDADAVNEIKPKIADLLREHGGKTAAELRGKPEADL